jgi:hypothetical protein
MDPFLEDPGEWSTVHARLITTLGDQLVERVGLNYGVKIEQRVTLIGPDVDRSLIPDALVVEQRSTPARHAAAAGITPAVLVEPVFESEVRERFLVVLDRRHRQAANSAGRMAFLQKQREIMASAAHWIEIDLLREGERPLEVAGRSHYYTLLKRAGQPGPYEVWYIDLRDRLPTIAVPLLAGDADVPLDLQAAFEDVYQRARYATEIDYTGEVPAPPLAPKDAAWVQERLAARRTGAN